MSALLTNFVQLPQILQRLHFGRVASTELIGLSTQYRLVNFSTRRNTLTMRTMTSTLCLSNLISKWLVLPLWIITMIARNSRIQWLKQSKYLSWLSRTKKLVLGPSFGLALRTSRLFYLSDLENLSGPSTKHTDIRDCTVISKRLLPEKFPIVTLSCLSLRLN